LEKAKRPSAEKRVAASCYDELRSRKREESGGGLGESERERSQDGYSREPVRLD
jgi:hypothetical protein